MSPDRISRPWDEYNAYIFDIDDTLLHCDDAVHYFAFCNGLETLTGQSIRLDGVKVHGSTDTAILRDALTLAGLSEQLWRSRLHECCACMRNYVAEHTDDFSIRVLPGVPDVLTHLSERRSIIGLGTGNLKAIAESKLRHCDLLKYFRFGGFSDDVCERSLVIAEALRQARALAGANAAVCVIGDTPSDVKAARANDLDVIAVASGPYPMEELLDCSPDWCFSSLEEMTFFS